MCQLERIGRSKDGIYRALAVQNVAPLLNRTGSIFGEGQWATPWVQANIVGKTSPGC